MFVTGMGTYSDEKTISKMDRQRKQKPKCTLLKRNIFQPSHFYKITLHQCNEALKKLKNFYEK